MSKFFCSTSTDLEKCKEGCCGKCEVEIVSGLESCQIGADEEEEEEVSENEEEEEEEPSENEEKGEDDSEANGDVDWWEDQ